jgi:hypothetical protein
MTLTSYVGYDKSRLSRDFQVLRKRIEHEFNFRIEYVKVCTSEGNGVIHCLFYVLSLTGFALGFRAGFIPQRWLSDAWCSITGGSRIVDIRDLHIRFGLNRLVHYLVSQYFSGQSGLDRLSYSMNWVFRGFRGLWRKLFAYRYFSDRVVCLRDWNEVLCSELHVLLKRFTSEVLPRRDMDGFLFDV